MSVRALVREQEADEPQVELAQAYRKDEGTIDW